MDQLSILTPAVLLRHMTTLLPNWTADLSVFQSSNKIVRQQCLGTDKIGCLYCDNENH